MFYVWKGKPGVLPALLLLRRLINQGMGFGRAEWPREVGGLVCN